MLQKLAGILISVIGAMMLATQWVSGEEASAVLVFFGVILIAFGAVVNLGEELFND